MENDLKECNDLIRRGDAIDLCEMAIDDSWEYDYAEDRMFEIPAVDAVEVVRCADCKYLNEDLAVGGWDGSCRFWNTHSVTYSWFCSQGQRREDGDAT